MIKRDKRAKRQETSRTVKKVRKKFSKETQVNSLFPLRVDRGERAASVHSDWLTDHVRDKSMRTTENLDRQTDRQTERLG